MRTLILFQLLAFSFAQGIFVGLLNPLPQYRIDPSSIFESEKGQILETYGRAVTTLVNCKPFFTQYPTSYQLLRHIIKKPQYIGFDKLLNPTEYIAYTNMHTNTIWLGHAYFNDTLSERERDIAHELLHIVGFSHTNPLVFRDDALYRLTDACFPFLPKEAL